MNEKKIGIIGGSFDPVHQGHLHLANEIQEKCQMDEIWFIPCKQNPLKNQTDCAKIEDRIHMLRLAIQGFPKFKIDLRETKQDNPTYTTDTLRSIRNEEKNAHLVFIMASDLLPQIPQWKNWQQLTEYAHLIFTERPGYQNPRDQNLPKELEVFLDEKLCEDLSQFDLEKSGSVFFIPIEKQPPISASMIREHIRQEKDIFHLVPNKAVKDYINSHKLYI